MVELVELSNGGLMELSNCCIVECWNGLMDKLVELSARQVGETWNDVVGGVVESSKRRMVELTSSSRMVEWWREKVVELSSRRMMER